MADLIEVANLLIARNHAQMAETHFEQMRRYLPDGAWKDAPTNIPCGVGLLAWFNHIDSYMQYHYGQLAIEELTRD